MPFGYPVVPELARRRVVVFGVGAVAEGKVDGLLAAGADDVLVIATGPARRLDELAGLDGVRISRSRWHPADLDGADLCIAWSADPGDPAGARRAQAVDLDERPPTVDRCQVRAASTRRRFVRLRR